MTWRKWIAGLESKEPKMSKRQPTPKPNQVVVRRRVAKCSVSVEGMDFVCPLCHTTIHSGERHECDDEHSVTVESKKAD